MLSDECLEKVLNLLGVDKETSEDVSIQNETYQKFKKAFDYANKMVEKEAFQAVEGLYHNLNTLQSRSGNQLPFTSINYGTCTLPEGRLVTKVLLDVSIDGIGKLHRTPIFPCGIFQYMKGVNDKEGTPNYDLYRLALKSTAKRLYPNYANVDWSGNAGYDINNPSTYFSTMGALAGHEHLYIRINDGDPIDISIKDFYELCNGNSLIKGRPMQLYYNKPEMNVPTDYNWRRNQNHSVANDIKECSGVYKVTYIPEDISYIGSSSNIQQRVREHKKCIRHKGGIDAGLNFEDTNVDNYKFEVLEYVSDYRQAEKKYINIIPNANFRGTSSKYYKNVGITRGMGFDTRPSIPMNPDIPQDFIDLNELNIKVLDKGNTWVKVKHVFKNSEFNTPLMMHITYVENGKTYSLCCTEDHPLWTGTKFTKACELTLNDVLFRGDGLQLPIKEIKYHYDRRESYDIGTETGTFIGSDILMHNCRTANGVDINQEDPKLKQLKDGRGNLCPVTVILPKIAMMAKERAEEIHKDIVDVFFEILENKIEEAKDMLIERYHWLCMQSPDSARFMYENHVMYGYKEDEGIESALKHGTLSLGQLGLAETLQILVGCNHTKPEGMKLAKKIEGLFAKKCREYKEGYKLNFGVYYTPAENLCYTAMKKFKEEYGEIPNVSDRDYFTNSMHVPVWEKLSPFDKIDIESQLTGFSSAGCITYVELDGSVNRNIDALEQIVDYAMGKDIPYFAVNVPSDLCLDCGYQGEINNECPQCHSKNIQQLRRVTGYLTGNYLTAFNKGKQEEVHDRVKHANKLVDFEGKELEEKVNF